MNCKNCGKELPDGSEFCSRCGSKKDNGSGYEGADKRKTKKAVIISIVAVVLVAAIVLGVIFIPDLIKSEIFPDSEERLREILQESTTKPIVEMVYDDYDSDGEFEAYAIVGETYEEDAKHPEFYDADIYFVNQKKAQKIKENVSGKTNDVILLDDIKYISIEVYEDGTKEGKSFIYSADGEKSIEADISGKYSEVHQEGNKIVAKDENGNFVEIDKINFENTTIPEKTTNNNNKFNETELKAIAEKEGLVNAWEYADYDGDDKKEAFAVITDNDLSIVKVLFFSSDGNMSVLDNNINSMLYLSDEGNVRYSGDKGFFWFDYGAGGSGWSTKLYSVDAGLPYESQISGNIQGFYEDDGIFYTTENEFLPEGGHVYNSVQLIYNYETHDFTKGDKINSNY